MVRTSSVHALALAHACRTALTVAAVCALAPAPAHADETLVSWSDDDDDRPPEVATREEGTHFAVRVEPPFSGVGQHGLTTLGANLGLRHGWFVGELGLRQGTQWGDGTGAEADLRVGTSLGGYGRLGGVRLNLTGGVARVVWSDTHEYTGSSGDLLGAGGEASIGYVALGGFDVRLAAGVYRTLTGTFEPNEEDGAIRMRPPAFGQVGLSVGYEF